MLHQTPSSDKSHTQASLRDVAAIEDLAQIGNSRACIADANNEHLRGRVLNKKFYKTAFGIWEGVASQFRSRSGEPDLFLVLKSKLIRDVPRSLACLDDVPLLAKPDG